MQFNFPFEGFFWFHFECQRRRRWGAPPQVLGYQLTLFGPRGADYAPHITTGPPIFLDDVAPLASKVQLEPQSKYPVLHLGLLVVQDICFWAVSAAGPVHEKSWGRL